MSERETFLERNWQVLAVIAAVMLFVVVPIAWNYMIAPTVIEQNADSGQDIAEDTFDSENAMQEYREFRTLWYDIQAQHRQTENYRAQEEQFHETYGDDPSEWSRTAENDHSELHTQITGSMNQEEMLIAEYNSMKADSTSAIFACGLPNRVDQKLFVTNGTGVSYTSQDAAERTPPEDPSECKYLQSPDPDAND